MALITLITDWSQGDYYVGSLKGRIYSLYPEVSIVDIANNIPHYKKTIRTAFILQNTYINFPKGTVHMLCINSESTNNIPHIAIFHDGHYFIGSDNGIFSLALGNKINGTIIKIENTKDTLFPEVDVFAEAAVFLAKGGDINQLGPRYDSIKNISMLLPTIDNNAINGSIIYIDSYGNGITNISYDLFEKVRKHRDYEILIKSNFYKINCIHTHYYEVEGGELFAVFNSLKLLEIGISYGNMANQLNLNIEDIVRIKFID